MWLETYCQSVSRHVSYYIQFPSTPSRSIKKQTEKACALLWFFFSDPKVTYQRAVKIYTQTLHVLTINLTWVHFEPTHKLEKKGHLLCLALIQQGDLLVDPLMIRTLRMDIWKKPYSLILQKLTHLSKSEDCIVCRLGYITAVSSDVSLSGILQTDFWPNCTVCADNRSVYGLIEFYTEFQCCRAVRNFPASGRGFKCLPRIHPQRCWTVINNTGIAKSLKKKNGTILASIQVQGITHHAIYPWNGKWQLPVFIVSHRKILLPNPSKKVFL